MGVTLSHWGRLIRISQSLKELPKLSNHFQHNCLGVYQALLCLSLFPFTMVFSCSLFLCCLSPPNSSPDLACVPDTSLLSSLLCSEMFQMRAAFHGNQLHCTDFAQLQRRSRGPGRCFWSFEGLSQSRLDKSWAGQGETEGFSLESLAQGVWNCVIFFPFLPSSLPPPVLPSLPLSLHIFPSLSPSLPSFLLSSSPEDMLIGFRERGREGEREGEKR